MIGKRKKDQMKEIYRFLNDRFTDESSSQDFFNATNRKLSDDQSDFVPITCKKFLINIKIYFFVLVDSEIDCNNCMADVNDIFCDKHTFLPCIEPEV